MLKIFYQLRYMIEYAENEHFFCDEVTLCKHPRIAVNFTHFRVREFSRRPTV